MYRTSTVRCFERLWQRAYRNPVCSFTIPYARRSMSSSSKSRHQLRRTRRKPISNVELSRMSQFTGQIINSATYKETAGWSHTRSLRGEEKRLTYSLKRAEKSPKITTLETAKYQATEQVDEDENHTSSSVYFEPGTFIEGRRNEAYTHGVVLYDEYDDRRWYTVILTASGEIWKPLRSDIMFSVPGFAAADLIARCGTREITTNKTELMARVELLRLIRQVEIDIEGAFYRVGRSLHDVYIAVRSSDPDAWTTVSLTEATRIISNKTDIVTTFAVHKQLMERSLQFVADADYAVTQTFHVRPQSHIQVIEAVTAMSRLKEGPLDIFARRARDVMLTNQTIHTRTQNQPPTQSPANHEWDENDQQILQFLLLSLRPYRSTQKDPYLTGVTAILKKLYAQLPRIDDSMVHQTLVDLGILAPWQDLASLRPELRLDHLPEERSPIVRERNVIAETCLLAPRTTTKLGPLGPEDFHPVDPLEHVRHDFGDMNVYVIDDPHAQELDDGISVEPVPSEPGSHWIHVHIADPAHLIPQNHIFAEQARNMGETHYFIHRTWPMLPKSLMQHGLSLSSSLRSGTPARVLTFSGKIDVYGDIVDFYVRAGLVKNIHITSYDAVDQALGFSGLKASYPFLDEIPSPLPQIKASLTDQQIAELQLCNSVAQQLLARRLKRGVFAINESISGIRLVQPLPDTHPTLTPTMYSGFPKLEYCVYEAERVDTGSRQIVAEMMKAACRIASRFGLDRNLPLLRRAGPEPVADSPPGLEELLSRRSEYGYITMVDANALNIRFSSPWYTTNPAMHWGLGVPEGEGYVRVTSPLRRYADMVAHWQIHHALLAASVPFRSPPFSENWLQEYGVKLLQDERTRRRAVDNHEDFWKLLYLKHQMLKNGVDRAPFSQLTCLVMGQAHLNKVSQEYHWHVGVLELGVRGTLEHSKILDISPGSQLPVKIDAIRLGTRPKLVLRLQ